MTEIKSPLRYPGGKSKAIKKILPFLPKKINEFREPFVGGGSVFIALKQRLDKDVIFKINDINYDLFCFWKSARDTLNQMVDEIIKIKNEYRVGRALFDEFKKKMCVNELEHGVRFFVLNRITFSGTVDSGGYSQQSFEKRFTKSSIERLKALAPIMKDVQITYEDYKNLLFKDGKDVFIFLDPPYFKTKKSRLYGKDGDLHILFDHNRFAKNMRKCKHKWLITYDNSPEIVELFDFANIYEWEHQYGMNNYKQSHAKKGRELFITNYDSLSKNQKISIDKFL